MTRSATAVPSELEVRFNPLESRRHQLSFVFSAVVSFMPGVLAVSSRERKCATGHQVPGLAPRLAPDLEADEMASYLSGPHLIQERVDLLAENIAVFSQLVGRAKDLSRRRSGLLCGMFDASDVG